MVQVESLFVVRIQLLGLVKLIKKIKLLYLFQEEISTFFFQKHQTNK